MSFLDNIKKINEQNAEEKMEEKKSVNPLLRFKKKVSEAPSSEEQKENSNSMLERLRARRAAEKNEIEPEKKDKEPEKESLQERAEAAVKAVLEKDDVSEEKKVEVKEEKPEEPATEEVPKEEKEEKESETESLVKEVESEPTAEEAEPKKRRRRGGRPKGSKNKKIEEEPKAEESVEEEVEVPVAEAMEEEKPSEEVPDDYDAIDTKLSYKEAAGEVLSYYIDDEWKAKQKELDKRLSDIRVDGDMNSGTIRFAISELSRFNDEIRALCVEQEQAYELLTNKDYGLASTIAAKALGKNEAERKRNALKLLAHYKPAGVDHEVNVIALAQAAKVRVLFLRSLCRDIDRKSDRCITFQNALKTEASLIQ